VSGFVLQWKQVCVQLPASADNVALPTFGRHATARRTAPGSNLSISLSYPPGAQQKTCRTLPQRSTDRRTDTGPFHRPCSAYYAGKKVKVAHTRLPSVGFRGWSRFLAVSLEVMWVINPAVGCHYFPPGLQLPPRPLRRLLQILLLGEQRHNGCEQFA